MAEAGVRYALVTGGNKGIGLEICKQLASKGIKVILTSRDEKRGRLEALQSLNHSGHVVFHQLNVVDSASIAAAAQFVTTKYGRLDILVNNAGILGAGLEGDVSILQEVVEAIAAAVFANSKAETSPPQSGTMIQTYEDAEECMQTNLYGVKRVTEALIPLLQLSASPTIVNVSSIVGHLNHFRNERAKAVLSNEAGLTEERIDEVVREFLSDFKEGRLEENEWLTHIGAAYQVSKAALNAYTKVLAKKHTDFIINSLCPGFARTDLSGNLGAISAEEAAQKVVRVALLPRRGPSGAFFYDKDV
ncbi:hypothetical protein SASPL_137429 [Salvia splendens]|uniref:(+)-neomenthol dehydrogenase n=1 Tax=Salvia splendens TaxID=180675 RepID=A0A8X8ZDG2_SALSN|nr:(-)-isopiperitenone reductase-like [Salvia splendens]KAG6400588.1 hypothetical protein SASPL_137429 [Salvia splendens]